MVLLCGGLAGWLVSGIVPPQPKPDQQQLYLDDYRFEPRAEGAMAVNEARPLPIPRLLGDFDLQIDLELGEHTDVDLLLRQVEPRYLQDRFDQFQGRFTVLRLSSSASGPAWRTREQALFGPRDGGAELAAGIPATVWVKARGRMLQANVAGRNLPWVTADDEYGMVTLVARGGPALVHRLVIKNLGMPRAWLWARSTWVLLGVLGAALLLAVLCLSSLWAMDYALAGALLVVLTWALARRVDTELGLPDPALLLGILTIGLLAGALVVVRGLAQAGVVAAALLIGVLCEPMVERSSPELDAVFGPKSGETPSRALARQVRGPIGIHSQTPCRYRVFLLGGALLFDRQYVAGESGGANSGAHLGTLLTGELRAMLHALATEVDVPSLPTLDGHTQQQWRMFATFFTDYAPNVLVFGVPRDEAAIDSATGAPRSSPQALAATLAAARDHAKSHGNKLVVFSESDLAPDLLAVLRQAAGDGVPLVLAEPGEASRSVAKRLAQVIVPLLR